MFGRTKIAALVAEFLGAGILTLVVLSVQRSSVGVPYFWAIAAGLTVALFALTVGRSSTAQLNPAVTLGLWTVRRIGTVRAVSFIIVQLLGAWAAYGIYKYFTKSGLPAVGGDFAWRAVVAEAIGAGVLTFGFVAAMRHKLVDGTYASLVGLSYIIGLLIASAVAIGLINPALALGVHAWDIWGSLGWGNYVLGPVVGAIVGANLYQFFFADDAVVTRKVVATTTTTTATTKGKKATAKKRR